MNTQNDVEISSVFYQVTEGAVAPEALINKVKTTSLSADQKYAYQAFCCAMLAKSAGNMLQKGKYIQQYGVFIEKAMAINSVCYEARLFRFLVEKKLEHVRFTCHMPQDRTYLLNEVDNIQDGYLKKITIKALEND